MPGKKKNCRFCQKILRSDNCIRHEKICQKNSKPLHVFNQAATENKVNGNNQQACITFPDISHPVSHPTLSTDIHAIIKNLPITVEKRRHDEIYQNNSMLLHDFNQGATRNRGIENNHETLTMKVYGIELPSDRGLTNIDIENYVKRLEIPYFRGVFMRDTLPAKPRKNECAIVNLNTSKEIGSHWVCLAKIGELRCYFDSFGQDVPIEIKKYLKTVNEYKNDEAVIARNTDIVQRVNSHVCGHLCLFVLTSLMREHLSYQQVLDILENGYSQADW